MALVVGVGVDVLAMLLNLKYTYCSTTKCNFEMYSSNLLQSPTYFVQTEVEVEPKS